MAGPPCTYCSATSRGTASSQRCSTAPAARAWHSLVNTVLPPRSWSFLYVPCSREKDLRGLPLHVISLSPALGIYPLASRDWLPLQ
eukprot:2510948-Pyramimonas_sp.AAC.2